MLWTLASDAKYLASASGLWEFQTSSVYRAYGNARALLAIVPPLKSSSVFRRVDTDRCILSEHQTQANRYPRSHMPIGLFNLQQVLPDDNLTVVEFSRAPDPDFRLVESGQTRDKVRQNEFLHACVMSDLSSLLDWRMRLDDVALQCLVSSAADADGRIHPFGVEHLVDEDVGPFGEPHQATAARGVA